MLRISDVLSINTKGLMKILVFCLPLVVVAACSNPVSYERAIEINEKRIDDEKKRVDARFLVHNKSSFMLQQELMKIAASEGYASAVVTLGKTSKERLEEALDDLKGVANSEDIDLPDEMSLEHQQMLAQVKQAGKAEIDQRLLKVLLQLSEEDRSRFSFRATEAADPDVRAYAARKIGMMREYVQQLESVGAALMNTDQ